MGGLERANGGATLETGLGRGEDRYRRLWGSDEAMMRLLVSLCPRPSADVSSESEVF
jgi:hypothetical protein